MAAPGGALVACAAALEREGGGQLHRSVTPLNAPPAPRLRDGVRY
jgi:hypothetical protein